MFLADVDQLPGHPIGGAQPLTEPAELGAAVAHDDQNVGVAFLA